jgi:hypothetical protein
VLLTRTAQEQVPQQLAELLKGFQECVTELICRFYLKAQEANQADLEEVHKHLWFILLICHAFPPFCGIPLPSS